MFFFVVAPFCSCPASLVSRKFFAVGPGCAKCFFFVALRWAPRPFGGARAKTKKNTTQGVFFVAPAPGKGKGRRSPVGSRHGARAKKKNTTQVFVFLLRHFFFALAPCRRPTGLLLPLPFPGAGAKKKHTLGGVFFFCSGPVPASNGASPSLAFRRGRSQKKNTLGGVFFFCSGPVPASNGASPSLAFRRGRSKKKKNTLGGVFFFAAAPRGRSVTHCGPGWRCLPLAGAVFFFVLRPRPDRGGVFFFAVAPPGRSLTHGGLGRFRQGPGGVFFFAAAPPGLFRQ